MTTAINKSKNYFFSKLAKIYDDRCMKKKKRKIKKFRNVKIYASVIIKLFKNIVKI